MSHESENQEPGSSLAGWVFGLGLAFVMLGTEPGPRPCLLLCAAGLWPGPSWEVLLRAFLGLKWPSRVVLRSLGRRTCFWAHSVALAGLRPSLPLAGGLSSLSHEVVRWLPDVSHARGEERPRKKAQSCSLLSEGTGRHSAASYCCTDARHTQESEPGGSPGAPDGSRHSLVQNTPDPVHGPQSLFPLQCPADAQLSVKAPEVNPQYCQRKKEYTEYVNQ